ncbi:TPA: DUF2509 family protein [Citrobacter freundii]
MSGERGVSSLAMVLLLLVLGSLLLSGMNQQQASFARRVVEESQALQRQAVVQSALEWGRMQPWSTHRAVQCRSGPTVPARVCLRFLENDTLLLIANYDGVSLWQWGELVKGEIRFSAHGWSDFCPLNEVAQCQIP